MKTIAGLSRRQLLQTDPEFLLAIIREKAHMTVEGKLYQAIYAGKPLPANFGQTLRGLLEIWSERGLPEQRPDIQWCRQLLALSEQVLAGEKPAVPESAAAFSPEEQAAVSRLIHTRRSVRVWQERAVPADLIRQVLEAGLWAPHACNLQATRYLVLEGEEARLLRQLRKSKGTPVGIVVAQDLRGYQHFERTIPAFNRDLDCGAAVQNMLLTAHALGLGAVWMTFDPGEAEALHERYHLPEYIALRTYIAVGWPAQKSLPHGRKTVEDALLPKADSGGTELSASD